MRKLDNSELNRLSIEEYKITKKNPFVLVLDNVRSLHNVGSAFRTADAFLASHIYLCGITGTPPHREIHKTALGATDSVSWSYHKDINEVVHLLKHGGYKVVAVEQVSNSLPLQNFFPKQKNKYAFVFGNEVFGVDMELIDKADTCLEIPQFGTKHSLNISVSIGVVCWDFCSKLLTK